MTETIIAERWIPRADIGLQPLYVEPARFGANGQPIAYRCQKEGDGAMITMARRVLEAYYRRDGNGDHPPSPAPDPLPEPPEPPIDTDAAR